VWHCVVWLPGGGRSVQNCGNVLPHYTMSHPIGQSF
jgi:hypothetical protein